jgi:hypothetical protein
MSSEGGGGPKIKLCEILILGTITFAWQLVSF